MPASFTKGCWECNAHAPENFNPNGKGHIISADGQYIASVQTEQDAKLISYAPEMYSMLDSLKDTISRYMNYPDLAKAWCRLTDLLNSIDGIKEIPDTEYTDTLKPCPFCGSGELALTGGFYVRCLNCDAQSGVQYSKAHAVQEWNLRHNG